MSKTLFRKVVSGAEDPKLLATALPPSSVGAAGDAAAGAEAASDFAVLFSSLPPVDLQPNCSRAPSSTVVQMYAAANGAALAAPSAALEPAVGVRIACGETEAPEKNWIGFMRKGQLYFVYSIHPHVVVQARAADGACVERFVTSSFRPLAVLAASGTHQLHGSATAVLVNGSYLALFHTIDADGMYATMLYTFAADPPFAVTAVSRPLPLQGGGGRNFASGLLVWGSKVVVSYGEDDRHSRALVMSTSFVDELFREECDS